MPLRIQVRVAVLLGLFGGVAALLLFRAAAGRGWVNALLLLVWVGVGLLAAHLFVPQLDLLRRSLIRLPRGERTIALTFDDGPAMRTTAQVLACLARHQVQATFFMVGEQVRRSPELVQAVVAAGHAVGNHGLSHRVLCFAARATVAREIVETQRRLEEAGVPGVRLFRAPHGWKSLFWGHILAREGLTPCAWTRGVWDSDAPPAPVIADRVLHRLRAGEIILLHDGPPGADRSQTVAALDLILPECKRRGFRFVTLEQVLPGRSGA